MIITEMLFSIRDKICPTTSPTLPPLTCMFMFLYYLLLFKKVFLVTFLLFYKKIEEFNTTYS